MRTSSFGRTIRVNYGGSCIDITGRWIHLAKKPYPCHTRCNWRILRLRRGPYRLWRGAARKGKDADGEPDRSKETKADHHRSSDYRCWGRRALLDRSRIPGHLAGIIYEYPPMLND